MYDQTAALQRQMLEVIILSVTLSDVDHDHITTEVLSTENLSVIKQLENSLIIALN